MKPTMRSDDLMLSEKISLNTTDLMKGLSCGRSTAVKIGEAAGAKIQIGKRILWNCNKIRIYIDSISTD